MAESKQGAVFTGSGLHVYTTSPSGDPWECPADYLPRALALGFVLTAAPVDHSLDGAPQVPAKKVPSKPGD